MNVRLIQRFTHDNGEVRVLAQTEAEARAILARNAWDKKDPCWHWYVSEEAKA